MHPKKTFTNVTAKTTDAQWFN